MSFTLQPVRVGNGFDEEGMLVFNEDHRLVAVLTHLSEKSRGSPGHWFLEAEFGRLDGLCHPIFPSLAAAKQWIEQRLTGS